MRSLLFGIVTLLAIGPMSATAREWVGADGKRFEAELVIVRGDKVVLETDDGKIVSLKVSRLAPSDRQYLKSKGIRLEPTNPAADADLAAQMTELLKAKCYRCHGKDGAGEGGFNFAMNLEKVAQSFVRPDGKSQLIDRVTGFGDTLMPPSGEGEPLDIQQIKLIERWIEAGTPTLDQKEDRPFISNREIVELIFRDLRSTPERSRRFIRYFTLTHLYNAGDSNDELQTFRNAFLKLTNSLSWNTKLIAAEAIDDAQTIYRLDIRDVHWSSEAWAAVEDSNPYFVEPESGLYTACTDFAETDMPFVRIDWFVFAASKPPLYHTLLGLPETDQDLEQMLRVNVAANIEQESAVRAGFNRSGVSQNNRLIEWHKSPYGSYWKSYDFGSNTGRQNLFRYPMGPDSASDSFIHDGGEIIFTLPNGLQGYLLVDGHGERIDQGPVSIVTDPRRQDRTVTNGVSCMSCHYAGVIPKRDEVGPAIKKNRRAFEDADDILALYQEPERLDGIFKRDGTAYTAALSRLGITNLSRSGESVSSMALKFQQDVDLVHAAAEFGIRPDDLLRRLSQADLVARVFSTLQVDGGAIKRDVFAEMFQDACVDFRLIEPSQIRKPVALASSDPRKPGTRLSMVGTDKGNGVRITKSTSSIPRRVTRRPIDIPLENGYVRVERTTKLRPGMKLRACWARRWHPVTIVAVHSDGTVKVNWDTFSAFTYDMLREDLAIQKSLAGRSRRR